VEVFPGEVHRLAAGGYGLRVVTIAQLTAYNAASVFHPFRINQTSSPSIININAYRANPHTAPSGLAYPIRIRTQGVALGYHLTPRWG